MNFKERGSLTELAVSNMTYPKLMDAMDSLKDDPLFRNGLVDAIRNYAVSDDIISSESPSERVCNSLMLAIFRYIETEVRNG